MAIIILFDSYRHSLPNTITKKMLVDSLILSHFSYLYLQLGAQYYPLSSSVVQHIQRLMNWGGSISLHLCGSMIMFLPTGLHFIACMPVTCQSVTALFLVCYSIDIIVLLNVCFLIRRFSLVHNTVIITKERFACLNCCRLSRTQ